MTTKSTNRLENEDFVLIAASEGSFELHLKKPAVASALLGSQLVVEVTKSQFDFIVSMIPGGTYESDILQYYTPHNEVCYMVKEETA